MCVCEQTIASSLVATVAARTKVASMSTWITVEIAFSDFRTEVVNGRKCAETLMIVGLVHVETKTVSTR